MRHLDKQVYSLRHSRRRKDNNPPGDRGPVFPYGQTLRNRAVRGLRRDAPSGASVSRSVSGNVTSFSQPLSEYRCCCTSVCYTRNIERMMYIERQNRTDNRSTQRGFLPGQAHAKNYGGEMEIYYFVLPHAEADTVQ